MEIIEITPENIETYLADCIALQKQLVSNPETINPDFFKATAGDNSTYFVGIVENEALVGISVIGKLVHPVNVTGYINNVVVDEVYRGKGFFSVLMDVVEAKARDWGCTDLALTCGRDNVQGLYQKRGFSVKDTNFYIKKI